MWESISRRAEALANVVRERPLTALAAAAGAAAAVYAVVQLTRPPPPPFRRAPLVRFDDAQGDVAPELQAMADAIRSVHAEGVFTEEDARALNAEFVDLARSSGTPPSVAGGGEPTLDRAAVAFVLRRVGVADPALADRVFEAWDVERRGVLDRRTFLHALVLVLRGTAHEKLSTCFTIADINGDGACTWPH